MALPHMNMARAVLLVSGLSSVRADYYSMQAFNGQFCGVDHDSNRHQNNDMQDDVIFCEFGQAVANGTIQLTQFPGQTTMRMGGRWCNLGRYHRNGAGDWRWRIHCDLTSTNGAETFTTGDAGNGQYFLRDSSGSYCEIGWGIRCRFRRSITSGGRYRFSRVETSVETQPPTRSPTTREPTLSPTRRPSTTSPTAAPTRPVVNTLTDCGPQHVDCLGWLDTDHAGAAGITCSVVGGAPRCACQGAYHCHLTETMGRCAGPNDSCLNRTMTAVPTAMPTDSPSPGPTATPTATPSGGPTTLAPSSTPTTPAPSSSGSYAYDMMTRYDLERLYQCNDVLPYGPQRESDYTMRIRLLQLGITQCPTNPPTLAPSTAASVSGSESSASEDDAGSSQTSTLIAVIVVALILILIIVGSAVFYVNKKASATAHPTTGFENPMYASASPATEPTTGYMDVGQTLASTGDVDVQATSGITGYMDVAPEDIEEDV